MSSPRAGCICVNGRFCDPENASVSALDAGFLLGDGLFESLRAVGGVPYLLDRHLLRLFSAAGELGFTNMPSTEAVGEQVHETLRRAALDDAYVRVTITRGSGAVGLAPPTGPPTLVIAVLPTRSPPQAGHGLDVTLLRGWAVRRAAAKSTSWQHAVLARRDVASAKADEGLYVSDGEGVLEGVASNVFAVEREQLLTPAVSECLPGITRGRVLELARAQGLEVLEAPLALERLMRADEVFLTNAVQGLRAVGTVSGAAIGGGDSAAVFPALQRLYEQDRAAALEGAR